MENVSLHSKQLLIFLVGLDFVSSSSDEKILFTNCQSKNSIVPYSEKEVVKINGFDYRTLSVPMKGRAKASNLGDLSYLFISQDTPREFEGTSRILVRSYDTVTKKSVGDLIESSNPNIIFVHSIYNQFQIKTDLIPNADETNIFKGNSFDGRKLAYLADLPMEYVETIPKVPNLRIDTTGTNTYVPFNYHLSFNITPLAINPKGGSILHYSSSQYKIGALPTLSYSLFVFTNILGFTLVALIYTLGLEQIIPDTMACSKENPFQ